MLDGAGYALMVCHRVHDRWSPPGGRELEEGAAFAWRSLADLQTERLAARVASVHGCADGMSGTRPELLM